MTPILKKGRSLLRRIVTPSFRAPTREELAAYPAQPETARIWPHTFAVISWGCAGTSWLAKTLNSHAEILCVHDWRQHVSALSPRYRRVSDLDAMQLLHSAGENYQCVGDVHSVRCHSITDLTNHFNSRGISIAGITRSPLPRLRSQMALFARHKYDHRQWGDLRYLRREPGFNQVKQLIESSPRNVCFAHGCCQLNAINVEVEMIPQIFRLEDLTTQPGEFVGFVNYLSGGRIELGNDEAAQMINLAAINQHRKATQKHIRFTTDEVRILQAMVLPESWDHYEDLGYERPAWAPQRLAASRDRSQSYLRAA